MNKDLQEDLMFFVWPFIFFYVYYPDMDDLILPLFNSFQDFWLVSFVSNPSWIGCENLKKVDLVSGPSLV